MSRNLMLQIRTHDLVYHVVFYDKRDADGRIISYHQKHEVAGLAKIVKPSYVKVYCPYLRQYIRLQRSEITKIISSYDDMRPGSFIHFFPPASPLPPRKSLIITGPHTHTGGKLELVKPGLMDEQARNVRKGEII